MALRILERARTEFQEVVVRGDAHRVEFQVAGAVHAFRDSRHFLGLAWEAIAAAALLHEGRPPRSILMLGLAGGTVFRILRHLLPDAVLEAVEIDPGIIDLARRHMAMDELGITFHTGDARDWLVRNRRKFDVVIDDCYLAGRADVFRPHGLADDIQHNLLRAIKPDGLLAVNLVTGAGHRSLQSAYRGWFRGNFPDVFSLTTADSQNEILVGGKALARPATLRQWEACFPQPSDRRRWNAIRARRLRPKTRR